MSQAIRKIGLAAHMKERGLDYSKFVTCVKLGLSDSALGRTFGINRYTAKKYRLLYREKHTNNV
jgi:hypothetical protein